MGELVTAIHCYIATGGTHIRKRHKIKNRACGLCKPHKRSFAPRWKSRDLVRLVEFERDCRTWLLR